jgi:hypothetical protein
MDPVEHSRLLYLVEALTSAPAKSHQLLRMATEPSASPRYREALERLKQASEINSLLAASGQIREELK